jgi:hypothetical protein
MLEKRKVQLSFLSDRSNERICLEGEVCSNEKRESSQAERIPPEAPIESTDSKVLILEGRKVTALAPKIGPSFVS